jgi:two-component system, OmpR family, phosphate regulon response regulator PhoB
MSRPLILVVDDDGPILLLMRSLLRQYDFDVMQAGSGPQALEEARRQAPDLILLDRHMPGMSGDEVLRELRAQPALASVPVLILSGEPMDPDEIRSLGATGAVLKPFDIGALIGVIRAHLGN